MLCLSNLECGYHILTAPLLNKPLGTGTMLPTGLVKKVHAFGVLWNKKCVGDIQNENVNRPVKGHLRCDNFVW